MTTDSPPSGFGPSSPAPAGEATARVLGGYRRTAGRGVESHTTAHRRGRTDASDGDGVLITVRTSKTNQEGDTADVRYLKNGAAAAIRILRAARPDAAPTDRVIGLSPIQIQRRFTAAAHADKRRRALEKDQQNRSLQGASRFS